MSIFIYCNPPNALLSKKAITHQRGYSGYEYELPIHLITAYISFALVRVLRGGRILLFAKVFSKTLLFPFGIDTARPWKAAERG